jgi:hypothetical protein
MRAIEAVEESVWAMASHPSGKQVIKGIGFTISTPGDEDESLYCAEEENLTGYLADLGLDDDTWQPNGPEGLYDVFTFLS